MTKRIISLLLTLTLLISLCTSISAEETAEETPQFFSVNMKVIFYGTTEHPVEFMIYPGRNNVYIRADDVPLLTGGLGYIYTPTHTECALSNKEIGHMIRFFYDSTTVKIFLLGKEVTYTSPLPAKFIDNVAWLPFDFVAKALNFNYTFPNIIEPSELTPLTALSYYYTNQKAYVFDWIDEVGYSEESYFQMSASALTVDFLSAILAFEPGAWAALLTCGIYTDGYEKEFIDTLTHLFVAPSNYELNEEWEVKKKNTKFWLKMGDTVSGGFKVAKNEFSESFWKTANESKLKEVLLKKIPQLAENNKFMTKAKSTNSSNMIKKISESSLVSYKDFDFSVFEIMIEMIALSECIASVENANKHAVEAMNYYGNNSKKSVAKYFKNSANTYNSGWVGGIENYVINNFGDFVMKGIPFDTLLGPSALLLYGWSLLSSSVPFFKDGLDSTENFILSKYAINYQDDSYLLLNKSKSLVFKKDTMNEEKLGDLINSGYAYMKFSIVARDAACSAINSSRLSQSDKDTIISKLKSKNEQIAKLLTVMSNEDYGFLPSESDNLYLINSLFLNYIYENGTPIEYVVVENEPVLDFSIYTDNYITSEEAIKLAKDGMLYGMGDLPLLSNAMTAKLQQAMEENYTFTVIDEFYVEDYGLPAYVIKLNEEDTLFFVPIDGKGVYFGIMWYPEDIYYDNDYRVYLDFNLLDPSISDYMQVIVAMTEDLLEFVEQNT